MTNITFIFETSPNTNPKEKKWGGHGTLCPPRLKNGGTRPPCPPPNCAHDCSIGDVVRYDIKEISTAPFVAAEVDESTDVTKKLRSLSCG